MIEIMNITGKKFLRTFMKYDFLHVRIKNCSTSLSTKNICGNFLFDKSQKNKRSLSWPEADKILDSILASDISPYINKSEISRLRPFFNVIGISQTKYSFVVDSGVAKDIVDRILPELKQKRSLVVEANPGLGLITLNLIKSELPVIHIYDHSQLRRISLQQLINRHPTQIHIEHHNILTPMRNKLLTLMGKALNLDVNNKIIAVVQHFGFFNNFVQECVSCSLWKYIQATDFFLIVTKNIWKNVMQDPNFHSKYCTYCFFNFIFETKLLAEYPSSAFLPYSPYHKGDKMFFVKISKRSDFPGKLTYEDIKLFQNFCKVLGRSKFNYIIPTLEQWIPDCGPYLISKGISMTNQISDLSYKECHELFNLIKKFSGFQNITIFNEIV